MQSRTTQIFWKITAVIVCVVFAFAPLMGSIGAQPAHAQADGAGGVKDTPTLIPCGVGLWCTDLQAAKNVDKFKSRIDFQLTYAAYLGVLNAATLVVQQLAYDTATWIADGGHGQGPLIETLLFKDYAKNLMLNAAGEFIGTLSENFTKGVFGVNLCQPPRFSALMLQFQLTIPSLALNGIARPKPKCAWTDIVSNWEATYASLDNLTSFQNIKGNFTVGGNDVAFGLGLNTAFFDAVAEDREAGILQRLEGKGYKPVQNFLSGNIETPASLVQRNTEAQIVEQANARQNLTTADVLSKSFELGWVQLGTVAASTFTNVLVSRLLGKLTKGLFKGSGTSGVTLDLSSLTAASPSAIKPEQVAASQYSDILTPNITSASQQDILAELVGCPDNGRSKWNCAINSSLEAALRQGNLTVQQAVDRGFFNAGFQLIPLSQIKDNTDPTCAQRAFCSANLKKMRLARIIPIGWEMAADSSANQQRCSSGSGCITLGEVLRNFDNCNTQGQADNDHPWCHMIDPDWVLAQFPTQCLTKGYSNAFIAGTNQRVQECQDSVSCLERDAQGNCIGGYGYCLAEQTRWQFDAQKCEEQNATCRSYTPRGNGAKPIGYLRSTIDYGSCNADNVGCMWYSTARDTSDPTKTDAWVNKSSNRVYFDATLSRCDQQYDGCSDLRRVQMGQPSLNLIDNGSFERTNDQTKALDAWLTDPAAYPVDTTPVVYTLPQVASGSPSAEGSQAYLTQASPALQQAVHLVAGHQYTLSFFARAFTSSPSNAGMTVQFYRPYPDKPSIPPRKDAEVGGSTAFVVTGQRFFQSSGCAVGTYPTGGNANGANILLPTGLGTDWQRFECSFVAPVGTSWGRVVIDQGSTSWLADGVKLEESETATAYSDGLNQVLTPAYLKVPPAELGCTGDATKDNPLCKNYAQVCGASEAGCQGYSSVGDPGSAEVPAVLTAADTCPASCVGYEMFRKQASTFDLVKNPDVPGLDDPEDETSVAFIPSTSQLCTEQDVGCESFTNIGPTGNGAENIEAYSYIRSCELPDDSTQTYYTWEGSEASGYQLVTWSLQRDTNAPLPQGPRILVKPGPDGSLKDPVTCNALSYVTGQDPDCRQFYDPDGNASYRYESQTVLADAKCTQLRKDHSDTADCTKTGGDFLNGVCVYRALTSKSNTCSVQTAGCRAYAGTQGRVVTSVYKEDFNGTSFTFRPTNANTQLAQSEESVLVGDKSLRVTASAGNSGEVYVDVPTLSGALYELTFWAKSLSSTPVNLTITTADPSHTDTRYSVGTAALRPEWNVYRVGPFYGTTSTAAGQTRIYLSGFSTLQSYVDTVEVTQISDTVYAVNGSWKTPAECDQTPEGTVVPQAMLGCRNYTDRNGTTQHVRQFSRLCRETSIGCSAYVNTQNSDSAYAQRWDKGTNTCKTTNLTYNMSSGAPSAAQIQAGRTAAVGFDGHTCLRDADCTANITGGTVQGTCDAEATVRSADAFEYYIDDKTKSCPKAQVSCRAFGLPQYNQDRTGLDGEKPFTTVYIKDDVTQYDKAICSDNELFCEAFKYSASNQSGTEYFRAPSTHACEYRTGVIVAVQGTNGTPTPAAKGCNLPNPENYVGTTYDGWFKTGQDCPCYPELLHQGANFGIRLTGDPGYNDWSHATATSPYAAWTGTCPNTQAECTEFRDVNDKTDPNHPTGRPYFVINDEKLDLDSCNGKVDPGRGCVLFRDMGDPALTSNSGATFESYKTHGYQPVGKIDCVATPQDPSCVTAQTQRIIAYHAAHLSDAGYTNCIPAAEMAGQTEIQAWGSCSGLPALGNDTNIIIKVTPDRACSEWLACKTSETVYDAQTGAYKSVCSDLALCNDAKKSDTGEGIPFCTSYVDRSPGSNVTILTQFNVLNAAAYSGRKVGFGAVDYTGYSIPDHFQVVDTALEPIGSMLSNNPQISSLLKKDYRLAVGVPMSFTNVVSIPNTATLTQLGNIGSTVSICYFAQTGAFGIITDSLKKPITAASQQTATGSVCWLAVDQTKPVQLAGTNGATLASDNLNTAALVRRFEQVTVPQLDQTLSTSFPNTQCKAAPEPDSPFGNEFIVQWDGSVNPPLPKRAAPGYGNANFCEYGEQCSCTYKRVKYGMGNVSKFYEPLSTDVVDAVCVGGPRDGLTCIPNSGVEGSINVNITASGTRSGGNSQSGNADQRCGEGGTCMPISGTQLVRGVTGQCLEYDNSRAIAGDQTRHECLIWDPSPVFAGPGDQYHWSPTAGFQPPQSSGRYYCTSATHQPRTQQFNAEAVWPKDMPEEGFDLAGFIVTTLLTGGFYDPVTIGAYAAMKDLVNSAGVSGSCSSDNNCKHAFGPWVNGEGYYAGRIKALFFADWFTSDGECSSGLFSAFTGGCTGNVPGASLDGYSAKGTAAGKVCENLDQDQPYAKDENIMRLVTTGQGANRSYAEYAILFNPWHTAYAALGFPPTDWGTTFDYSLEDVIANFTFTPPQSKIECAYTNTWGNDGPDGQVDEDHWGNYDSSWHAGFNKYLAQGGQTLNRSSAQILTEDGTPDGIPLKTECVVQGSADGSDASLVPDGRADDDGLCYMKTWELDYRSQGQQKFQAFIPSIARNGVEHLSRRPVYGKCDSSNAWFSIRAVFEDTNHGENMKDPTEVSTKQLVGPFQFVGLWVTSCAPGDQTQYIYLNMKMNSADVCRELAETISKDSHDSVAFTDRNWSESGYSMKNGFSWNTTNIPFGASLATGDAGKQPLFMTGVKQSDVNPMNPPTFTSPGQTYFSSSNYPTSNWGLLSNVFAKIYRIYGYDSRGVSRDDWACTNRQSPNFGQWCPVLGNVEDPADWTDTATTYAQSLSQEFCGVQGKCIAGGIDGSQLFSQKACNTFSGVNRGLDCTNNPDICHIAPMTLSSDGALTPQYGNCTVFQGYSGGTDAYGGTIDPITVRWEKLSNGKYRCARTNTSGTTGDSCPSDCQTDIGCTRAEAIRNGALRCQGSVRDPGMVKEFSQAVQRTYASYCTKEALNNNSSECPIDIPSGSVSCIGATASAPGTCAGYSWAQCTQDSDCTFEARNYYPSGSVNSSFYWSRTTRERDLGVGQHNPKINSTMDRGAAFYYAFERGGNAGDDQSASGLTWFDVLGDVNGTQAQVHANTFKDAFWPAIPVGLDMGGGQYVQNCGEKDACFYATRIQSGVYNSSNALVPDINNIETLTYNVWDDTNMLRLYPGFNPNIWWGNWTDSGQLGAVSANINYADNGSLGLGSVNSYYGADRFQPLVLNRVLSAKNDPNNPLSDIAPYVQAVPAAGVNVTCRTAGQRGGQTCTSAQTSAADNYATYSGAMFAQYGACESVALAYKEPFSGAVTKCTNGKCAGGESNGKSCTVDAQCTAPAGPVGTCRGGGMDGVMCSTDKDCVASQYQNTKASPTRLKTLQDAAKNWCNPVTTGALSTTPYGRPLDWTQKLADSGTAGVADACWTDASGNVVDDRSNAKHPSRESDPELDNNMCTHPAGYWPKPQYCLNADDEFCGLFGYNVSNKAASIADDVPLPTDVTQGLYTPLFLNSAAAGGKLSNSVTDYAYADYYNPVPPHTAAPDIRSCQGSRCRVTGLDTLSLDGFAEGTVNGGAGNHVASLRFYGWASDNQMPLRKVYIDWGDGTLTQLPDAHLKNHKPYCQTPKECSLIPGLTCETDADCPAGGGTCVSKGYCTNSPKTSCTKDSQCNIGGQQGNCQARTPFGNDADACDEQYFEFRHAYSCMPQNVAKNNPPTCTAQSSSNPNMQWRCSGSTQISCTDDTSCPAGDHCLKDVAPYSNFNTKTGGCFDVQTNTCRYTPRVMLVDNWGWCTGECRGLISPQSHLPVDNASVDRVVHPNGGCYDASLLRDNSNITKIVGYNECSMTPEESTGAQFPSDSTATVNKTDAIYRPWIVFPGSVSLLPGEGQ